MREAFGDKYGVSSILAPDYWYLRGMDPKAMESSVDWFNFMGYDLHGAWDGDIPVCLSLFLTYPKPCRGPVLTMWLDARSKNSTTH
jgi:GH18 family chitinase